METLQKTHYNQTPLADINESLKAEDGYFAGREAPLFGRHGHQLTAAVQRLLHGKCRSQDFTPARKYFDPSLYLKTIA
jgi:NitT/TauT family transport system substrate-binding protein